MINNCNIKENSTKYVSQCGISIKIGEYVTKISYLVFTILASSDKIDNVSGSSFISIGVRQNGLLSLEHVITDIGG